MTTVNSESSFQKLDVLADKLKFHVTESEETTSSETSETLLMLFTLLFDFTEPGQVKVAEKCGLFLVQLLSDQEIFLASDSEESVNYCLLIISGLCQYDTARSVLVETTSILKICIDSLIYLKGNNTERNRLRDKVLSCLSTLIRGYVEKAVDAGIVNPMIDLLGNDAVVTDQKGASGIILSLIESERGQAVGARVLLSGIVPMLLSTLAKPIPVNATATNKADYRHLQIIGLRNVACVLRHQKLARESASQFFATSEGENHLKSVVEFARHTSDVSHWIFAAEILVWLGSVQSCQGLLGRLGAKQALQKVVSEADPYGKWVSLVNQAVSVKTFPTLWNTKSIFHQEQHAFLAFWVNRYACGGLGVSADAHVVREKLCSEEWIAFLTTLLASSDNVTRRHAHIALLSLRGESVGLASRPITSARDDSSKASKGSSSSSNTKSTKSPSSSLYSHLVGPIGIERSEEKQVIDTLSKAKLPLHILLRPGIKLDDIDNALTNLSVGTRLAVIDNLRELREKHAKAKEIVQRYVGETSSLSFLATPMKPLHNQTDRKIKDDKDLKPECFISYCWAQKAQVKVIKATLENHGIRCWMDEQQMEGGSMLFEEIDEGISASEVVLSCLSPEYTKSVNCNREVLLATDRNKATIPVVVGELEHWPPRGNLGPILAGKLYIKIGEDAIRGKEQNNEFQQLIQSVLQLLKTSTKNT